MTTKARESEVGASARVFSQYFRLHVLTIGFCKTLLTVKRRHKCLKSFLFPLLSALKQDFPTCSVSVLGMVCELERLLPARPPGAVLTGSPPSTAGQMSTC